MMKRASKKNGAAAGPARLAAQVEISAAEHRELDRSALHLMLAIYRAFAVLDRNQAEELTVLRLTPTQFNILMTLYRAHRPLTMGELASMLVVRPTNLSGLVNTLRDRGLVRREVNYSDQRSFVAMVTGTGQRLLRNFLPGHWSHLESIMKKLPEEDRLALVELLQQLVASIEATETAPAASPRATRSSSRRASGAKQARVSPRPRPHG